MLNILKGMQGIGVAAMASTLLCKPFPPNFHTVPAEPPELVYSSMGVSDILSR